MDSSNNNHSFKHKRTKSDTQLSSYQRLQSQFYKVKNRYDTLFNLSSAGILISDNQSYYLDANPSFCKMLGYERKKVIGLHASDIVAKSEYPYIESALDDIQKNNTYFRVWRFKRKDDSYFDAGVSATKLSDGNLLAAIVDFSAQKRAEKEIKRLAADLKMMNNTIMILLEKIDEVKLNIEKDLLTNFDHLVLPLIQRLKLTAENKDVKELVKLIENRIKNIISPFANTLLTSKPCLTPAEIHIAELIRQGLSNKEIAELLSNSVRTITSHRHRIRCKLGLKNTGINLRSYLQKVGNCL